MASSILVFGPTFADRSFGDEVALHGAHEPTEASGPIAECSGASATDHACYQQRYESLVRVSGVAAAFAELQGRIHEGRVCKLQLPSPNPRHRSYRCGALRRRS